MLKFKLLVNLPWFYFSHHWGWISLAKSVPQRCSRCWCNSSHALLPPREYDFRSFNTTWDFLRSTCCRDTWLGSSRCKSTFPHRNFQSFGCTVQGESDILIYYLCIVLYNAHILIKHTYVHTVICRVRPDNKETEKLHPLEPKKNHEFWTLGIYISCIHCNKNFPISGCFYYKH